MSVVEEDEEALLAVPPRVRTLREDPLVGILLVVGTVVGLLLVQQFQVTALIIAAVPAALLTVYIGVRRPLVALVVLQVVAWSGASGVLGNHGGFSLYTGALVVGVVSLFLGMRRDHIQPFGRSPIYVLVTLVAFAQGLSLLLSRYPLGSLSIPVSNFKDLTFFVVSLGLLRMTKRYKVFVIVIVLTIVALAALSLVQQFGLHNSTTFGGFSNVPVGPDIGSATARHSGPEGDANFWGRTIVLTMGLCLALAALSRQQRSRERRWWSWRWLAAAVVLAGGEYLTSSRGDLIAFILIIVLWSLIVLWSRPRYLLLVLVVFAVVAIAVPGVSSRLGTLAELTSSSQSATDPSLLGRVQAQEVGLAMFRANPEFGVGVGNFIPVEPQFVDEPGITQTGYLLAPHDLYLELASEQGITGVGAWLLFFGGSLLLAFRASVLARKSSLAEFSALSFGVVVTLVGWATASLFLHLADLNELLALVALAAALDMEVRSATAGLVWEEDPFRRAGFSRERAKDRLVLAARLSSPLLVGAAAMLLIVSLVPLRNTEFQGRATAAVSPTAAPPSGENAYTWSTVGGAVVVPTFARIAISPRFVAQAEHRLPSSLLSNVTVTGTGDLPSSLLEVSATAPKASTAAAVSETTLVDARDYLRVLAPLYQVSSVASTVSPVRVLRTRSVVLYGAVAVLIVVGFAIRLRRVLRRGAPRSRY